MNFSRAWIGRGLLATSLLVVLCTITYSVIRSASQRSDAHRVDVVSESEPRHRSEVADPLVDDDLSNPTRTQAFRVLVTDDAGDNVAGLSVRFVKINELLIEESRKWPRPDWGVVANEEVERPTTESSAFEIPEQVLRSFAPTVAWVRADNCATRCVVIRNLHGTIEAAESIVLERMQPIVVDVQDQLRNPAQGARVVQLADCRFQDVNRIDSLAVIASRLYRREYECDAEARATIDPMLGAQVLRAQRGDEASDYWGGTAPAQIRLSLYSTFILTGQVHGVEDAAAAVCVRWLVERGRRFVLVDRFVVDSNGSIGRLSLPVLPGAGYYFQLDAAGFELSQVSLRMPLPGESMELSLVARPAASTSVLVVDAEQKPIDSALVTGSWAAGLGWSKLERTTGADGVARFDCVSPGEFWIRAGKSGYASTLLGTPTIVNEGEHATTVVALERAGRLEGRCLHNGRPVSDCVVFVWKDDQDSFSQIELANSTDGRFITDQAPIGEVHVLATCDALANAGYKTVNVTPNETAYVECEFVDTIHGRGRVVDAASRQPISGASVQIWNATEVAGISPRGPPVYSNSDGRFDIPNLGPGSTPCRISADGYAALDKELLGEAGMDSDLGLIALSPYQIVRLRLVGGALTDATEYTARLIGASDTGQVHFDADGTVRLHDVEPGTPMLKVIFPNRHIAFTDTLNVRAGARNDFVIPVEGRHLLVDVRSAGGGSLEPGSRLLATSSDRGSGAVRHDYAIYPDAPVDVRVVNIGTLGLTVTDPEGAIIAFSEVEIEAHGPERTSVTVGSQTRTIRVVTDQHEPVRGAMVAIMTARSTSHMSFTLSTDVNGECVFRGLDVKAPMIAAYHPDLGVAVTQPLPSLGSASSTFTVVLNPRNALKVKVQDRSTVGTAIAVFAEDSNGVSWGLGAQATDDTGVATWSAVSVGEYRATVVHPGWWQQAFNVTLTETSPVVVLQARRVGSAVVQVVSVLGNPVAGARVDVRSEEMNAWASEWVGSGLVSASDANMLTDSAGHLRLDGLPNGDFEWRVTPPNGEPLTGRVNVPPLGVATLEVRVP